MPHRGKVVVVGQGYVGLPLALLAAESGYLVLGLDSDSNKVASIMAATVDIPGVSSRDIIDFRDSGRYLASAEYSESEGFDVALLTLPTPLKGEAPDLSHVLDAVRRLAPHVRRGALIIVESTTFPGTTRDVVRPLLENLTNLVAGDDFFLAYSPERVNPGDTEWGLLNTPKLVSGLTAKCLELGEQFYGSLGVKVVQVSTLENAEFTKLLENTFRLVNISLINELSTVARSLKVDMWECLDAADTKPFGFTKFSPGPGVGGHCLPVDPVYLSWVSSEKAGRRLQTIDTAISVNKLMPAFIADRLEEILVSRRIRGSKPKVLLLGVSYKAGVGDSRESPTVSLAEQLESKGFVVSALDNHVGPHAWPPSLARIEGGPFKDVDVAVVLTAHGLEDWAVLLDSEIPILDTRNYIAGQNVEQLAR